MSDSKEEQNLNELNEHQIKQHNVEREPNQTQERNKQKQKLT